MIEHIKSYRKKIEINEYLFNQIFKGDVAIFAGAGISTEQKVVFPYTFYEDIRNELELTNSDLSFPEIMSLYVKKPDGRKRLIEKIEERFNYINSFQGLERVATIFHRELASLYPVKLIITTNWDLYFEKFCKAIPFVTEKDMAFWNQSNRNVLKIHGTVNSYGSIIATREDYERNELSLNNGLVGSKLKSILAEKNIVFIGYSYRDSDFQELHRFVKKQLKEFQRQTFVVTPFEEEAKRFEEIGITPIITDGTYFIELVKKKAIKKGYLLPDSRYLDVQMFLMELNITHMKTHEKSNIKKFPQILFTMAYQDGISDALERILHFKTSGEYLNPNYIPGILELYEKMQEEKDKSNALLDVAYIEGYTIALCYMFLSKSKRVSKYPPMFYPSDVHSIEGLKKYYKKFAKKEPDYYKKELIYLSKIVSNMPDDTVYQHTSFLI